MRSDFERLLETYGWTASHLRWDPSTKSLTFVNVPAEHYWVDSSGLRVLTGLEPPSILVQRYAVPTALSSEECESLAALEEQREAYKEALMAESYRIAQELDRRILEEVMNETPMERETRLARDYAPQQVGDINSTERGSGARFNSGKPPLHLIPAWIVSLFADDALNHPDFEECPDEEFAQAILGALGEWQENKIPAYHMLRYFDADDLAEAARVFDYGRKKYAEWNWAKGMAWSVPTACIQRHALFGILQGEVLDAESGYTHVGHILCNVIMLVHFAAHYTEGDDRPLHIFGTDEL